MARRYAPNSDALTYHGRQAAQMLKTLPHGAAIMQGVTKGGVDLTAQYNTLRRRWKAMGRP